MQREDSKGMRIIFQSNPGDYVEFTDQFVRRLNERDMSNLQGDSNTILFADLQSKSDPFFRTLGITIVFSSPDENRYREFMKLRPMPPRLVLNPLVWEDIKDLGLMMIKENQEKGNVLQWNISDVEKNFILIGGIPRFVFTSHDTCNDVIENALKTKSLDIYNNIALNGLASLSGADQSISYRLLNMRSDDNQKYWFCFATDEIAARLMAKFTVYNGRETIRAIVNNVISPKTKGDFFEIIGHALFVRRAEGYSLDKATSEIDTCAFSDTCISLSNEGTIIDVNLFKFDFYFLYSSFDNSLKKNSYYKMRAGAESVDSFTIIDDKVYFFQFTTAKNHPVSAFGIHNLCDTISKCFGKETLTFHLIFIGIAGDKNFDSMKTQDIIYTKDLRIKNVQRYKTDPSMNVTPSMNSKIKETITLNTKIILCQYKLGIKFRAMNDCLLFCTTGGLNSDR